jgi:F-box domain
MNPLETLDADSFEEILKYLPVKDLLNLSLVSVAYYKVVGFSSAISRIYLRFYYPFGDINCLLNTTRNYVSCKIQHEIPKDLQPVFRNFDWSHILMRDFDMDFEEYQDLIEELAPRVETLDLWDIYLRPGGGRVTEGFFFPSLKTLETNLTDRRAFSTFLNLNPSLRRVIIKNVTAKKDDDLIKKDFMEPTNIIQEFLNKNTKIKSLSLIDCRPNLSEKLTVRLDSRLESTACAHTFAQHSKYSFQLIRSVRFE